MNINTVSSRALISTQWWIQGLLDVAGWPSILPTFAENFLQIEKVREVGAVLQKIRTNNDNIRVHFTKHRCVLFYNETFQKAIKSN